ncbi:putative 3-dehydroshikimate dehydratase [Rosellinia necatrix]|uniref:Putative 3-dehydroshikimate dehydratase n=1 Tax=Rosellinia necatrix TaxID=77044 RepID=A0A1S7UM37_ROSNE|nr:putative 3-dehydroshikimate dehydratase [Rosellinia necatrix]
MHCRLAITSMSLGRCYAGHSFVHKLDMAHMYGYQALELFYEDLVEVAQQLPGEGDARERELEAAGLIRRLCHERGIVILCLQPFAHYEGLVDRQAHAERIEKLKFWFRLARALRTDMIQIPTSFGPAADISEDAGLAAADLREAADLGLQQSPPIRFVYEALCFGTRYNTWEHSWDMVRAVDRPNFGLCLDTFNIAGRVYADPAAASGRTRDCDEALRASVARLVASVDVAKVFYVQVVDAERLAAPLVAGHPFHDPAQAPRMSWSRNCRLFYGEADRGAYLPVADVCRAIFHGLAFEGWVSMELFHRRMADPDPAVPKELASRGAAAWAKLVRDMKLRTEEAPSVELARVAASL